MKKKLPLSISNTLLNLLTSKINYWAYRMAQDYRISYR